MLVSPRKNKNILLHNHNTIVMPKKLTINSILSTIQSIIKFPQLSHNVFYCCCLEERLSIFIQGSCAAFGYHVYLVYFNLILPTSNTAFFFHLVFQVF